MCVYFVVDLMKKEKGNQRFNWVAFFFRLCEFFLFILSTKVERERKYSPKCSHTSSQSDSFAWNCVSVLMYILESHGNIYLYI